MSRPKPPTPARAVNGLQRRRILRGAAAIGLPGMTAMAPSLLSAQPANPSVPAAVGALAVTPAAPGQRVQWPDVTLLDGSRFTAKDAAGRAAVVVFWSTTCPFCRRHNQHVQALHRAATGQALTVLGVARDRDAAVVQRYAQQQGYGFPITMDYAPMAAALSQRNMIPLTVTVDLQGRLKQVLPGEMFEEDLLELLQLAKPSAKG